MVTFSLRIHARQNRREEILKTIRPLLGPTEVQPGCLSCRFYQDLEDENALTLVEEWNSQGELEDHIRSDYYRNLLAAMEMGMMPPEISFKTISKQTGFELIEAVREESTNLFIKEGNPA